MALRDAISDEREPLLRREAHERDAPAQPEQTTPIADGDEIDDRTTAHRVALVLPFLAVLVLVTVGAMVVDLPLTEISEGIVCRKMMGNVTEPARDPRCKEPAVQAELALLSGWELTFGLLPSLLVGVPFGLAADKYGRSTVLFLNTIGLVLYTLSTIVLCRFPDTFPLRLRWATPVFLLIGGGVSTMGAMVWTVLADVTTQAQRSTAFLYFVTLTTLCALVTSPLTFFLMNGYGAWFTVYFGSVLLCLTLPIAMFLPETRSAAVVKQAEAARKAGADDVAAAGHSWWDARPALVSMWQQMAMINRVLFVENPRVGLLLSSTVFFTVGKSVVMIMLQYVSKRFGWSWAKAGLLTAVKNAASLGVMAVILPGVSELLVRSGMAPLSKDWWMMRASAVISAGGLLAMGLAPTMPLFVAAMVFSELGGGLQAALRSVVTQLVDKTHIALVMTALSMAFSISEMLAGPMMAETFKIGMGLGGMWVGLPYIACAGLLAVGTLMVLCVPISRPAKVAVE